MLNDFWGIQVNDENEEVDQGVFSVMKSFEPIPNDTQALAYISSIVFSYDKYNCENRIQAIWTIMKPLEYANQTVKHNIHVYSDDPKKSEKARRMLLAIDFNAKAGLAKSNKEPTNESLQKLLNRPMVIRIQLFEAIDDNGNKREINWVSSISPKDQGIPEKVIPVVFEKKLANEVEEEEPPF